MKENSHLFGSGGCGGEKGEGRTECFLSSLLPQGDSLCPAGDGADEVKNRILWYYIGHCSNVCKIRGKRDHLLSFHGISV